MPVYDCGDPDCTECQRAFGPDRSKAFERYRQREEFYAELERNQTPHDVVGAMRHFHQKLDEVEAKK